MKYIIGDVEEVIDYRSVLIARSVPAFVQCFQKIKPALVFDIIAISASSVAQYKNHLARLGRFTNSNTVILTDGVLGVNFEKIIYDMIPNCKALTFMTETKLKYIGNSTYVHEKADHSMGMFIGPAIPMFLRDSNSNFENSSKFMVNRPSHALFDLFEKLRLLGVNIIDLSIENEDVRFADWLWSYIIVAIAGDGTALMFGEYILDYEHIEKVTTVSCIYDELLYIALQTGADKLHRLLSLQIDRLGALFTGCRNHDKLIPNQNSEPPYLNCSQLVFNFQNNMENPILLMIYHCLKIADSLNVQSSALSVLYGELSKQRDIIREKFAKNSSLQLNVAFIHVPTDGFEMQGPKFKRRKVGEAQDDRFFEINNDDYYQEKYTFNNMDFKQAGFPDGFSGRDEPPAERDGFLRACLGQYGNRSLINEVEPDNEIFDREFDVFRTLMSLDTVKRDSRNLLKIIKKLDRKVNLRDEIILRHNLTEEVAQIEMASKIDEMEHRIDFEIDGYTSDQVADNSKDLRSESDDSASLDADAQEILSNSAITKGFAMPENVTKANNKDMSSLNVIRRFHTTKIKKQRGFDSNIPKIPRSAKWLEGASRSASLSPNKQRMKDPQVFKRHTRFEYDSFQTKHQNILGSLEGVGEELVREDRYKAARSKSVYQSQPPKSNPHNTTYIDVPQNQSQYSTSKRNPTMQPTKHPT
ncbi:hypothetical protein WICPIJ_005687 [Wickerhamomyces pijperi]|uniref:Uncharacterized protein n=1 Tax=Wickerhamomyces pijperi TaxID=599730 RepID=A0A9P8Q574_WICPI|nr:hypothetical protein WICPIJ_005687 [Wickerhamomyces pijperi]